MKYPRYNYVAEERMQIFEFTSSGAKGEIKKLVEFTLLNVNNVYNLGFGDYDPETDKINDNVVTNNGDSRKVLATVVSTVYAFTAKILRVGYLQQELTL